MLQSEKFVGLNKNIIVLNYTPTRADGSKMRYLFQGDSITDAGRENKENPLSLGNGYPRLLAAELTFEHEDVLVWNTGISGNRVVDLLARWKKDCLNLQPDVLTILIGVNDVWHELNWQNGVSVELFEDVYGILLRETKKALPDTRIILMGAYVTHGTATDGNWDSFTDEVGIRRGITHKLALKYGTEFLDLQEIFDRASEKLPAKHWTVDGVHPTDAGHRLIANAWKRIYLSENQLQEGEGD